MAQDQSTESECIFCKIVAGRIPCHRLYEDDHVLSFLDVGPLSSGHSLVIPKQHWVTIDQVPAATAAACMAVVPKLSRAIMAATGATAWNVLQNNGKAAHQAVGHVHFHIIPKMEDGRGLSSPFNPSSIDHEDGARLSSSIRDLLSRPPSQ